MDILRLLFEYKADANITDSDGDTALHMTESAEIARLLIEFGADPTLKNDEGFLVRLAKPR